MSDSGLIRGPGNTGSNVISGGGGGGGGKVGGVGPVSASSGGTSGNSAGASKPDLGPPLQSTKPHYLTSREVVVGNSQEGVDQNMTQTPLVRHDHDDPYRPLQHGGMPPPSNKDSLPPR